MTPHLRPTHLRRVEEPPPPIETPRSPLERLLAHLPLGRIPALFSIVVAAALATGHGLTILPIAAIIAGFAMMEIGARRVPEATAHSFALLGLGLSVLVLCGWLSSGRSGLLALIPGAALLIALVLRSTAATEPSALPLTAGATRAAMFIGTALALTGALNPAVIIGAVLVFSLAAGLGFVEIEATRRATPALRLVRDEESAELPPSPRIWPARVLLFLPLAAALIVFHPRWPAFALAASLAIGVAVALFSLDRALAPTRRRAVLQKLAVAAPLLDALLIATLPAWSTVGLTIALTAAVSLFALRRSL